MKKVLSLIFTTICFLTLFLLSGKLNAQTTVIFNDDFEADSINSKPLGWELFGTTSLATVQYDSGTTNKMLRLNAGQTEPTGYAGEKIQQTLPFGYGDFIFSYKLRTTKLAGAVNTTNNPNFNRIGFNGIYGVTNTDNNTANATTSISPMGLQGILRLPTGLIYTPTGNLNPVNNTWYKISMRISRTSDTTVGVAGTVMLASNDSLVKTISGSIKTTTPTLLMNQLIFDIQAIYQYNYADIDDVSLTLPDAAPEASNVAISGTLQALQTLTGSYTLTGADTLGTTVQWSSSISATGPFTAIPGATSTTYILARNDIGKYIQFTVYPKSASGFSTGIPISAITATTINPHVGPTLITSIRQTGNVAATATVHINYTYQSPTNTPEKGTLYTIYVSDTFNLGYFKQLASGTSTAATGVSYTIDTSLVGKYLYIELLPQDTTGAYGQFSGWTAQTAVAPEIQILKVLYLTNGQDSSEFVGLSSGSMQVKAFIQNNNPAHDTTGRLVAQLVDGQGNIVATANSVGASLLRGSTDTLITAAFIVPAIFDGYSLQVSFVDSVTGKSSLAAPEKLTVLDDADAVYQYFVNDGDSTNGAYLWIPPNTPVIKGIIIVIKNNGEVQVAESPEVRKIAQKWGLAEISMPMGGKTFSHTLLAPPNYLSFDYTYPGAAAKFDSIIHALAIVSNHPELVSAPFIPMAHSAYMDFPFHVAMRYSNRVIAAIPIKSGMPDIYTYYKGAANGGTSYLPQPNANMNNVPILFFQGLMPETIDYSFKTQPMRPLSGTLSNGLVADYRTGDTANGQYYPRNDYAGSIIDLSEGHFNVLPRSLGIIAKFIDKACAARLPDVYPTDPNVLPVLKPLSLTRGWLVDANYQFNQNPLKHFTAAPYNQYTGPKKGSLWYFDQDMATTCDQLAITEYNKKVEQFTILKANGTPDTLYEAVYSYHPKDAVQFFDTTEKMTLTPYSFTAPWPIDTAYLNTKDSLKVPMKLSTNILLPGVTTLPITNLPVLAKTSGTVFKPIGNNQYKLRFWRYSQSAGGYTQNYLALYKAGNDSVAQSMRNIRLDWTQSSFTGLKSQFITFPSTNKVDVNTRFVTLKATASSGLPIEYFVRSGPGVVAGNQLQITGLPQGIAYPIGVVVGAYQIGRLGAGGYSAAPTVYQTIWIDNIEPAKPLLLVGAANGSNAVSLSWNSSADTLVNGYALFRGDSEIAILTDTSFIDTTVMPNSTYIYYVRSLNKLGNYSDTTNNVWITTPFPLPLKLANFTAALSTNNRVLCNWATANEINTASFIVERSTDGSVFGGLGTVAAKGNTPAASYKFTDILPTADVPCYYYRLKMIDKTGKYAYSSIVKVNVIITPNNIHIAPNPFKGNLSLSIDATENTDATLMITSINGKVLVNKKYSLTQGSNALQINEASRLSKGFYLLTITMGNTSKTLNIEKQ